MQIISSVSEMQKISSALIRNNQSIGFVPTMGYLHEGHIALIKQARQENEIVVVSIFVNPLQFGPNEDFETYPRDINRDAQLAEEAGADYLFHPTVQEMYPNKLTVDIKVVDRVHVLCGKKRLGHFDGVATVLLKLFSIIQPNYAYFGLKDAQQVAVVDGLITDLNLPVRLVAVNTVREADGLAKSSRNVYLTKAEREQAKALYQSLLLGKSLFEKGERNISSIVEKMKEFMEAKTEGKVEYIEILNYPDLTPLTIIKGQIIIAIAVQYTKARLIDNIIFNLN